MIQYKRTMEDSIWNLAARLDEDLDLEEIGQEYAYTSGYYAMYFSSYFTVPFYKLIHNVRKKKGNTSCRKIYDEMVSLIKGYARQPDIKDIRVSMERLPGTRIQELSEIEISEKNRDDPLKVWEETSAYFGQPESPAGRAVALWWYDNELWQRFSMGFLCKGKDELSEFPNKEKGFIPLKSTDYAVFRTKINEGESSAEKMKDLIHYAHGIWHVEHRDYKINGFCLLGREGQECCYYMPVKKKKSAAVSYDKHSVDQWANYICDHIMENISVEQIAEKFDYSARQFKRVFSENYGMPITDYIRKCRLDILAGELRQGKDYKSIAELYGFFSYKGFNAAFIRYFGVTPKEYSKDQFDVIDLGKWREKNMDKINVRITTIKEIKVLAHPEIGVRGADVDIPAQMQYWLNKDYPSKDRRMAGNMLKRDDKIAMWYHPEDICLVDYVIGPVVESFPGLF